MNNQIPNSLLEAATRVLLRESTIDVDGQLKYRTNSLGEPIHSTDEGIRNFHRWFGNGVNKGQEIQNGKWVDTGPRVLWHETNKENEAPIKSNGFDVEKVAARGSDEQMPNGVFLKNYKERIGVSHKDTEHQMPVYARNKNPAYFMDRKELEDHMLSKSPEYASLRKEHTETNRHYNELADRQWNELNSGSREEQDKKFDDHNKTIDEWDQKINSISAKMRDAVTKHLKAEGHDSMVMVNDVGSRNRSVATHVIFDSKDIKHASENNGNFNETNVITESSGETDFDYPIQENPLKKFRRESGEFNRLINVDAKRFKDVFENDNKESLSWNQSRLVNLRGLVNSGVKIDAYPEVGIDAQNRLSVNDGRHRISHASELGVSIPVSVREEDLEKVKEKLK